MAFLELHKRYGSDVITLRLGNGQVVVVSGNKLIHAVLNDEDYDGRPWNEFIKMRNMGMKKGITMNDGPEWREVRAWLVRTFRTVGFGKQAMNDLIKDEVSVVVERLKSGGEWHMKKAIAPAVINVLWTLAAGKRCNRSRLDYLINLIERRARAFDMSGGLLSTFPWLRYIAPELTGYNILLAVNNELKTMLKETIADHKERYIPGTEVDLIDMFLRDMYSKKEPQSVFTDDQLTMILADLFIAGCSTTTTMLDFLYAAMCVNQDVQRKLHQEIDSVIPRDRMPDLEDRPKLPYTEAVLTETLRRWCLLPIIGPRRVLRDTVLGNYRISKGTAVLINLYSVHMNEDLFPDPYEFNPDRFIKNGAYVSCENVLAFGRGKRRCPGEVLARSALFLLFVGVMQKYRLAPVPGQGPYHLDVNPGLTISPKYTGMMVEPR